MRNTAANSAAVADLIMRHVRYGGDEQGMRSRQTDVILYVAPAHHCAETNAVVGDLDLLEVGNFSQVDQQARERHSKGHHRHQALAAGQGFGLPVVGGEERNGFGQRCRTGIGERG